MPKDFNTEQLVTESFVAPASPSRRLVPDLPAPVDPAELLATPAHLLAWLGTKSPDEIVTEDVHDPSRCLGCNFLAAHGFTVSLGGTYWRHRSDYKYGENPLPAWFRQTLSHLYRRGPVTAAQAIAAIESAISSRRGG